MPRSRHRELLKHPALQQGISYHQPTTPSGWPPLDALLPGGGWPQGALIELLLPAPGVGELSLLLPLLCQLSQQPRWLAWVAPPHWPYAPALAHAGVDLGQTLWIDAHGAERPWAASRLLACTALGAVLCWLEPVHFTHLRRLQLAAQQGGGHGFLFRPLAVLQSPSPARLRLELKPQSDGLQVQLHKGSRQPGGVTLPCFGWR